MAKQRKLMSDPEFIAFTNGKRLTAKIKLALRLHYVQGVGVTDACARSGASRPGFYRARDSLNSKGKPLTRRVTFVVPEEFADAFVQGGTAQILKYQAMLEARQVEYEASLPAIPTVGIETQGGSNA